MFVLAIALSVLVFVGIMALLHQLSPRGKKWITILFTFVAGLYFMTEYFWPVHHIKDPEGNSIMGNFLTNSISPVSEYIQLILIWTIGLGIISLSIVHGQRLLKRMPGWHNSLAFFLAMISFIVIGYISHLGKVPAVGAHKDFLLGTVITYKTLYGFLVNLDSTMFALLAFYIASAAYRAFRVRTVEAGLLMVSALIVMLGLVSFGVWLTSGIPADSAWAFFRFERLYSWLMNWFNMPVQRAVAIGVAVGGLAMAMRIWLSLERGSFFSQEK